MHSACQTGEIRIKGTFLAISEIPRRHFGKNLPIGSNIYTPHCNRHILCNQPRWRSVTTDGTAQTRTANKQNEITSISGATTPTSDANGNMTKDEKTGRLFVFDTWNREKIVKDTGVTTLLTLYRQKTSAYAALRTA